MNFRAHNFKALAVIALVVMTFGTSIVNAQQLADAQDSIVVSSPLPNQYVTGNVNTKFVLSDDDRANIPYTVTLRNNVCTNPIAVIKSGNAATGSAQSVTWNSNGPVGNVTSISDGKYCLEVCGTFRKANDKNYSACNSRYVLIRNHNKNPQISTNVPSSRTIYPDQSWRYDVNARDPEGDRLTFSLTQAPNFVSIDRFTGLIYTNSRSKNIGTYNIKVKVVDGFGGKDTQGFTLTVIKRPVKPASSSSSSQSSTSSTSSQSTSSTSSSTSSSTTSTSVDDVSIEFLTPVAGDILKGKDNNVSWKVVGYQPKPEDQISINLLIEGSDAVEVATLTGDKTTYNLDVTTLAVGEYRLEIELKLSAGDETYSQQSDAVRVQNTDSNPGNENNRPLVVNVSPTDGAEILDTLKPEIAGEFVAPDNAEIDVNSFKFFVDDVERAWCGEVTQAGFKCMPDIDLSKGTHKVRVIIADNQNRSTPFEWSFSIGASEGNSTDGGFVIFRRVIDFSGLIVLVVLCLVLLMLFGVPWVLFLIWRRRQSENVDYTSSNTYQLEANNAANPYEDNLLPPTNILDQFGGGTDSTTADTSYTTSPDYTLADVDLGNNQQSDFSSEAVVVPVADSSSASGEIDPLQFDSYEDYLAAVSGAPVSDNSNTSTNTSYATDFTESNTSDPIQTPPVSEPDPNLVNAPDYSDLFTASPNTGNEVAPETSDSTDSDNPDWLNPT